MPLGLEHRSVVCGRLVMWSSLGWCGEGVANWKRFLLLCYLNIALYLFIYFSFCIYVFSGLYVDLRLLFSSCGFVLAFLGGSAIFILFLFLGAFSFCFILFRLSFCFKQR